ncbi:4'-phosphopantetheinyl transferase family protein [Paludibacterium paludis]|uniref:Enterobactin synthase component D n=1 Tax=Paludibacterium paludis TaxID=1225769 RepID=A0A918P222_9NEIS|nr:4'-phosphopantetheinyl transferase superfamily protein [Paludibacterium paludis]GGY14734.1 4'-phosphopantetheinyl transferase [Paludibacterium paludis]
MSLDTACELDGLEAALSRLPPACAALRQASLRYTIDETMLTALTPPHAPLPEALSGAVLKRRVEFAAGRWCAREALRRCGYTGTADLAVGRHRAPCWPGGYLGSISHCHGLAVAIAAPAGSLTGVGIDLELTMPADTARSIAPHIATARERELGAALGSEIWTTLVFSAKESLFKALYPTVGRYFEFLDAVAEDLDPDRGEISLRLATTLSDRHRQGDVHRVAFALADKGLVTRCLAREAPAAR